MNLKKILLIVFCSFVAIAACSNNKTITIVEPNSPNSRLKFGVSWLQKSLRNNHYKVDIIKGGKIPDHSRTLVVGALSGSLIKNTLKRLKISIKNPPGKQGYAIRTAKKVTIIGGADSSGTLYGCLHINDLVKKQGTLPKMITKTDQPEMVLRGTCIGLQKTYVMPGRGPYLYPITPKLFPWFYNKKLWLRYLNMMVENRYNTLYLWAGSPFASLVRVKKYPYAVNVDSTTFRKNQEMYHFLTREANKRGIWVIQMFYNIIVPKPFAVHNHLKTQDRDRPIIPIIADYTRRSISKFVQTYPNVGLLVCLGEAMTQKYAVPWFTKVVIPGVKDGLKKNGKKKEPPIILRGHATNAVVDMKAALPLYHNLYTMEKYSGESLTTYRPRGPWAEYHRKLSQLAAVNIENVHINSNLEPFRWASPSFIRKCVLAMHNVHKSNGLHLYPQANYWDWPYTADKTKPRLLEMNRDWLWYKAWARYAWNCHRDSAKEHAYWSGVIGKRYGVGKKYGGKILDAYEQSGKISPMIIRRFGITEGNRQTMTLGMFMSQLVSPKRFGLDPLLYNSDGPPGEMITTYVKNKWDHKPEIGETPVMADSDIVKYGQLAIKDINQAVPYVTKNKKGFNRLKNDMYCYNAVANYYAQKVKAAMLVLDYKYSKNIKYLNKAIPYLKNSLKYFKRLVKLTKGNYLHANSLQTQQRRIPISGLHGENKTWAELLPYYQQELKSFKKNVALLKSVNNHQSVNSLKPAKIQLLDHNLKTYKVGNGAKPYSDENYRINGIAKQLDGLVGIRISFKKQDNNGTVIHFKNNKPVKIVVGYFNSYNRKFVAPSQLKDFLTSSIHLQSDMKIINAVSIPGLPPVNIHSYYYKPGVNEFKLKHGVCLILGFIKGNEHIRRRNDGFNQKSSKANGLAWMFY